MRKTVSNPGEAEARHQSIFGDASRIVDATTTSASRSVNAFMTAAYWMIGRQIVEFEQEGQGRAGYGEGGIEQLSADLTAQYGRGFALRNVWRMRAFCVAWPILPTVSAESSLAGIAHRFPLPWSAYLRLLSVKNLLAREFYETEAVRGSWSIRQIDRQINSQFYERTALSKKRAAMLTEGQQARPDDAVLPEEAIKGSYVLEFLDRKDEYSETDLKEALIRRLDTFLLGLGGDFCFVGKKRPLSIGNDRYRLYLLFFLRRLRCLVVVDLKIGVASDITRMTGQSSCRWPIGRLTHADAGPMHLYLNYAQEHWGHDGGNPPAGLILCVQKVEAVARYALEGLPNEGMAAKYRTTLPDHDVLASEIDRAGQAVRECRLLPGKSAVRQARRKQLRT